MRIPGSISSLIERNQMKTKTKIYHDALNVLRGGGGGGGGGGKRNAVRAFHKV